MEKEKTAIQMKDGIYSIDGKRYIPGKNAAVYILLVGGLGAGGLLLSGSENGQLRQENEQLMQNAAQNRLELTCEQLSKQDTSVRTPEGNVYTLNCDSYGNPVLQERRKLK